MLQKALVTCAKELMSSLWSFTQQCAEHTQKNTYLSELLPQRVLSCQLMSCSWVCPGQDGNMEEIMLTVAALKLWNELPSDIRQASSLTVFKSFFFFFWLSTPCDVFLCGTNSRLLFYLNNYLNMFYCYCLLLFFLSAALGLY